MKLKVKVCPTEKFHFKLRSNDSRRQHQNPFSTRIYNLGSYDRHQADFLQPSKNYLQKNCKQAKTLTRIAPYLNHNQIRLIQNSFFKGQVCYCPVIWTFCSRLSNHLINKFQERALRIAYNDSYSSFSELPEMANESTIHMKNLKFLLTEVYKLLNDLSPLIMNGVFQTNDWLCHLRNPRTLASNHKSDIKTWY